MVPKNANSKKGKKMFTEKDVYRNVFYFCRKVEKPSYDIRKALCVTSLYFEGRISLADFREYRETVFRNWRREKTPEWEAMLAIFSGCSLPELQYILLKKSCIRLQIERKKLRFPDVPFIYTKIGTVIV